MPQGHPPSAIWRLCPDIAAAKVSTVLQDQWSQDDVIVPIDWADAHLILIRKPAKTGKEASHYRRTGLQDQQLGKLAFKSIVEPHQELVYSFVMQYPQYGYTPGRSHKDALRRVFDHCSAVRDSCQAQHQTLHDRFAGAATSHLWEESKSRWTLQERLTQCPGTAYSQACNACCCHLPSYK